MKVYPKAKQQKYPKLPIATQTISLMNNIITCAICLEHVSCILRLHELKSNELLIIPLNTGVLSKRA